MINTYLLKNLKYSNLTYNLLYYIISSFLLFTGVSKIIDPQPMIETIKTVVKTGEELQIAVATLLPVAEIMLGMMLLLKTRVKETLLAVVVLFIFFFLFGIYGTVIGLENDCGCFGKAVESSFGIGMVIRNAILLIISIVMLKSEKKIPGAGGKIKKQKRINRRLYVYTLI